MASHRDLCAGFVLQSDDRNKCSRYQRLCVSRLCVLHASGEHHDLDFNGLAITLTSDVLFGL